MKKVLFSLLFVTIGSIAANAQPGSLDLTYGNNGVNFLDFGGDEVLSSSAMQSDGKIVAVGTTDANGDNDFLVVRINPDGSFDNSFGSGGQVVTDFNGYSDHAAAVAIQSNGKILVAGAASYSGSADMAVVRYNSNGTLDNTFDLDGKVTINLGSISNGANSIAIQTDNKIVIGGVGGSSTLSFDFGLARLNSDGSLDNSFGNSGKVITPITPPFNVIYQILLQNDGKIIAAGTGAAAGSFDFIVARYNPDGSLDSSFGSSGITQTAIGLVSDMAFAVAQDASDKIIAAGHSHDVINQEGFAMIRYNTDGSLDNTFGNNGIVTTQISTQPDEIFTILIQPDGKYIVGGQADTGADMRHVLARYNPDGSLDNTFGQNGVFLLDITPGDDFIQKILLQSDGKIFSGGVSFNGNDRDYTFVRILSGLNVGILHLDKLNGCLFIYPNPVKQTAVLEYTLQKSEKISIRLLDMRGRLIKQIVNAETKSAGRNKEIIHFNSDLPAGNYLIEVSSSSGSMAIQVSMGL